MNQFNNFAGARKEAVAANSAPAVSLPVKQRAVSG
jgi:hypothetical protein